MTTDRLAIGAVAGAHGVRGQFKVKPFTEAPRDVVSYGPVLATEGFHSTVTDFARLRGLSTSVPLISATWYDIS